MSPGPLHGVVYGHGRMGQLHAAKLRQRPELSLEIVDPAQGRGRTSTQALDFAIIATPTHAHSATALPLLEQGVPCLVEKPLAATLAEARQLAVHPHLSVGHIERFNPVFRPLTHAAIAFVDIQRLAPTTVRSDDIDVIGDLMIHDLDLLLKLMGGPAGDVRAKGVGIRGALPDMVSARIEWDIGDGQVGVANLTASRVSPETVRTWRVFAPGQYWSLDLHRRQAKTRQWSTTHTDTLDVPDTDPLTAEHDAFLCAVRGEGQFQCTGHEAVAVLELAERIRSCLR
jgi:predicted dehydrogenase